jgi:inorganic pyrophosphatase
LIGVIEAEQTEKGKTVRNDRLLAVVETPYNPPPFQALDELGTQWLAEVEHFFVAYNHMEGREFRPLGRHGPEKAHAVITAALHSRASVRGRAGKSRSRAK